MGTRAAWLVFGCVAGLLSAGCGDECVDRDGDQRGEGCERGPDCNDDDPRLTTVCVAGGADCAAQPYTEGCPCYAGTREDCYAGPQSTRDVGQCVHGRQTCLAGVWSECRGEVLPGFERCNAVDDDCDGVADEGVTSPCGGCNDACSGGVWGGASEPFEADEGVSLTARGELTLAFTEIESSTVWVPNTGEASVSKVDADSATEVARYRVAGATPERVAVDYLGDAWVLSPALQGRAALTKIVADPARCGAGRTSSGARQILPLGSDACVVQQLSVGAQDELLRTLVIDGTEAPDREFGGHLWLGAQRGQRLLMVSADDGSVLREVAVPGLAPFDAVFDAWGTLWLVDRAGLLGRVELAAEPATVEIIEAPLRCFEFDSIASDAQGVLTLTGAGCESVVTYDPRVKRFAEVKTPGVLDARGVAVLGVDSWVVHTAGRVSRVARDPLAIVETFELATRVATPIESLAVGADAAQRVWVVSSGGGEAGAGLLTGFDTLTGEVAAQLSVGSLPRPHGDITGSRRLGVFVPEAVVQHVFEGCSTEGTGWGPLHVAWTAGEGGSTEVEVRHAERAALLADAKWQRLGRLPEDAQPYATAFSDGGVVEVRLRLRAAKRLGAPRITRVGLEWRCAGPD